MLKRMSSRTLTEWMAYHNLEPFGDGLLDIHLANITAAVINSSPHRKKGSSAVQAKEFRLWKEIKQFDAQTFFENLKAALGK